MKSRYAWLIGLATLIATVLTLSTCVPLRSNVDSANRSPIDLNHIGSSPAPSNAPPTAAIAPACAVTVGQIMTITIASSIYGHSIPIDIYLPPCYIESTAHLAVIYLLHGGNADQTQWPDLNVESEADALIRDGASPFIVVMPGGEYRPDLDYAAFVLNDLVPEIARRFRIQSDRADQAIGGLSLGGYWALKIAFTHAQQFGAVGAYSPVVDQGQSDDPLPLARTADGLSSLRIMLDVGDADPLRDGTQHLADQLQTRSIPAAFTINPGGHNRAYWRMRTRAYLHFFAQGFTISP